MSFEEPVVIPYADMGDKADISVLLVILIIALVCIIAAGVIVIAKLRKQGGREAPAALKSAGEKPPRPFNTVTIKENSGAALTWTVTVTRPVTAGREDGCEIRLAETSVSRRHFKLLPENGVSVQNLSVSNITKVNGVPVTSPVALNSGDVIKCGRTTLVVESLTRVETAEGAENE